MSEHLWRYFWEDDVDQFVATLHAQSSHDVGQASGHGSRSIRRRESNSPTVSYKQTASFDRGSHLAKQVERQTAEVPLTKAEINRKDNKGLTLLHHAASSIHKSGKDFALSLLAHPLIDLYIQDQENGWTALHRAFYFGNITIARAIVDRESQQNSGQISGAGVSTSVSLIKIKDKEGLGPYDLLSATIVDRTALFEGADLALSASDSEDEDLRDTSPDRETSNSVGTVKASVNVQGDQVFTFGSNKNSTLGFGDEDDRQYPERTNLKRPFHLFQRFCKDHFEQRLAQIAQANASYANKLRDQFVLPETASQLPSAIRSSSLKILDMQMAKFHSAVLTCDPVSNLYICGHGLGGRLGSGSERTQFTFTCIEDFGSMRKRIVSVALGQDHTLAVTDAGEIFTWGSNACGQLGCGLMKENMRPEDCVQLVPKQLFGPLKRETIIGVAASSIHSVAHTSTSLFTFGKNEGQLGLVDSQAASLKIQSTPRQVQASRITCQITSVSAIDRATVCLLENREVHVFANYGAVKINFPLSNFSNYFLGASDRTIRQARIGPKIRKITAGGDTICALSDDGEIFTMTVSQVMNSEAVANPGSTTNPAKIRAALSTPHRAWDLRSDRLLAKDVGVDADGSVILCTASGGVFRRVRRARGVGGNPSSSGRLKAKMFKFMRVPNLTRVVAVRASASGAYAAIRQDCSITKDELYMPAPNLSTDIFGLLAFKFLASDTNAANPAPTFWQRPNELAKLTARLAQTGYIENELSDVLKEHKGNLGHDIILATSCSTLRIPVHSFLIAGRSAPIRAALYRFRHVGSYKTDAFALARDDDGSTVLTISGLDSWALVEFVLYLHTDTLIGFWQYTKWSPELAYRQRQVRAELIKIASVFELPNLETAVRRMLTHAVKSLEYDMETALLDPNYLSDGDIRVQLADGEVLVHSALMIRRCPFFKGLFQGRADGLWLTHRQNLDNNEGHRIEVDLTHIELDIFKCVLRHIYTDAGEELFDTKVTADLDEYLDFIMEVLSAANELMLDGLSNVCQTLLGRHVTSRNVCQLLNAVAPSSETSFKSSALEYVCLNLEAQLCNHWLDELEDDLMDELDNVVRDNQLAGLPFAKSDQADTALHQKYPELAGLIEKGRQARIDSLAFRSKFPDALTPLSRSKPSPSIRGKPFVSLSSPKLAAGERNSNFDGDVPPLPAITTLPEPAQALTLPQRRSTDSVPTGSDPKASANQPWGSSPLASSKLGMREIMNQASSSRTSNISIGLKTNPPADSRTSNASSARLSQKERKKQLQQQNASVDHFAKSPESSTSSLPASSPWKTITSSGNSNFSDTARSPQTPGTDSSPRVPSRPLTPQLTMRQTIANAPATRRDDKASSASFSQPKSLPHQQTRNETSPQLPSSPPPQKSPRPSSSSSSNPIQSIRHQTRPDASPKFYMHQSLADIISKEQADKATIKEAVAKRSLQEIQEEQAFQEWWDQESRAVQEAANAPAAPNSRSRGGRIRGASRGRRKGKERSGREDHKSRDVSTP